MATAQVRWWRDFRGVLLRGGDVVGVEDVGVVRVGEVEAKRGELFGKEKLGIGSALGKVKVGLGSKDESSWRWMGVERLRSFCEVIGLECRASRNIGLLDVMSTMEMPIGFVLRGDS